MGLVDEKEDGVHPGDSDEEDPADDDTHDIGIGDISSNENDADESSVDPPSARRLEWGIQLEEDDDDFFENSLTLDSSEG